MKQINGQLELFRVRKAPIYHFSLTRIYCECPKCHNENIATYEDECPECGQALTWEDEAIDKVAKKTKDYIECERLGLHGPVRKNDKGKWEEVIIHGQN